MATAALRARPAVPGAPGPPGAADPADPGRGDPARAAAAPGGAVDPRAVVFSSYVFLFAFLPLVLGAYYAAPRALRSAVLTLASYLFYGWWRLDFAALMLISTAVDFTCARRMHGAPIAVRRRYLGLSLAVNLGLLGYFKYAEFGVETLNALLSAAGLGELPGLRVVLPIGISFYTFQTLSYTIDVYRGHARPQERLLDFAAYVALFPQLVAGPIVRYGTVADQLRGRSHTLPKFAEGVLYFQLGLAKKVLLADSLAPLADRAFAGSAAGAEIGAAAAWLGAAAYAFQLYFDFSGYSDMALGLGRMFGLVYPPNFASPYRSGSITEFWRHWHVSLSSWLRDYLYVPLGGNRRGPGRTQLNLACLLYTSPSPRDGLLSRMPSSA